MNASGDDLVERLRGGDQRAFLVVYERLGDRIYSFALRLSGRRDTADELFQHAWLRLAEQAPRLPLDTNLLAWLLTVTRNQFRSQHRHERVKARHAGSLAIAQASAPRPDVSAERRALVERLEAALASLPEAHREVLALTVEADDVAQHDLAAILGLTPEAFRKRLSRARRALAELLENAEEEAS